MPPPELMAEFRRRTKTGEEKEGVEHDMIREWQLR